MAKRRAKAAAKPRASTSAGRARARNARRFSAPVLDALRATKYLGLRAGSEHRFIGLWVVLVGERVFVRSWSVKPDGWYRTFTRDPRGAIQAGERQVPVRAVSVRSERVRDAVDRAYRERYDTPAAQKYVRDLSSAKSRATTTELVPR